MFLFYDFLKIFGKLPYHPLIGFIMRKSHPNDTIVARFQTFYQKSHVPFPQIQLRKQAHSQPMFYHGNNGIISMYVICFIGLQFFQFHNSEHFAVQSLSRENKRIHFIPLHRISFHIFVGFPVRQYCFHLIFI